MNGAAYIYPPHIRRMKAPAVLCLSLLLGSAQMAGAQVRLVGEVRHDGKPLDQVMIRVYENNELNRTIAANKRGVYEMDFAFNKRYLIVFTRPFMVPVKIDVNTSVDLSGNSTKQAVEVPLNMEMMQRFKSVECVACDEVLGEIRRSGAAVNSFVFEGDAAVIAGVKAAKAQAEAAAKRGEKPVDEPYLALSDIATLPSATAKPEPPSVGEEIAINKEVELKSEVQNFEKVEEAEVAKAVAFKARYADDRQAQEGEHGAQAEFVSESKKIKSEQQQKAALQYAEQADALASANERDAREALRIAEASKHKNEVQESITQSSLTVSRVWNTETQTLRLKRGTTPVTYRKVIYDWGLFESHFHWKNDQTITATEYERVLGSLGY